MDVTLWVVAPLVQNVAALLRLVQGMLQQYSRNGLMDDFLGNDPVGSLLTLLRTHDAGAARAVGHRGRRAGRGRGRVPLAVACRAFGA